MLWVVTTTQGFAEWGTWHVTVSNLSGAMLLEETHQHDPRSQEDSSPYQINGVLQLPALFRVQLSGFPTYCTTMSPNPQFAHFERFGENVMVDFSLDCDFASILVVDQENTATDGTLLGCANRNYSRADSTRYQSFIPSAPIVAALELGLQAGVAFPSDGHPVTVKLRTAAPDGEWLGTGRVRIPGPLGEGQRVDVFVPLWRPADVTPGGTYWIEWECPYEGGQVLAWLGSMRDPYPGGAELTYNKRDLVFKSFTLPDANLARSTRSATRTGVLQPQGGAP
jgi:hypothetical protein